MSIREPDPYKALVPGLPSPWTWTLMQAVMLLLAATPASTAMVEHLVEGLRQEAPFLTPELIRRELAMIFAALVDPSFPGEAPTMP